MKSETVSGNGIGSAARRCGGRTWSISVVALAATAVAMALTNSALGDGTYQTLPFSQNWTNTGLITANDSWSGVPGIEGYLGQDITTSTGVDPQTLLTTSGAANDLDVIANQANPNTNTAGGVAEFEIANPVVALQGSGTADAPYLLLYLNTTGNTSITFSCNLRDIDGSTDNSVQPVAVQYRVGNTGNFTNLPTAFTADASTGPSLATLVTAVSVVLPAAANNQAQVQIRVITANAVGNDEWIGIDDISVTGTATPSITVTSPNGGESWASGSSHNITWTNSAFSGNVDILLSSNSGSSFPTTLFSNIVNTGSQSWNISQGAGANYRVRVQAAGGGSPSDDSNADFTITAGGCNAPTSSVAPASITQCIGGSAVYTCTATGDPTLSYQWKKGGSDLSDGVNGNGSTVSGAQTSQLTISNLHSLDAGNDYTCTVTSSTCSPPATSAAVTLTVNTPVCSIAPTSQIHQAGTSQSVTVTVTCGGSPAASRAVTFGIAGPNSGATLSPAGPYSTDGAGQVTVSYTGATSGTDTITATVTDGGSQCNATLVWFSPNVIINEVDSDTPVTDVLEFVELYDGGAGNTSLDGLFVVFWNGSGDISYLTLSLTGKSTNASGYFVLGNAGLISSLPGSFGATNTLTFADGGLQNGQDAVALYSGSATSIPNGTAVTATNVRDAVVYDTDDADDTGLAILVNAGQPQINEGGSGDSALHSIQRCPNGAGGARNTNTYAASSPTAGAANTFTIVPTSPQSSLANVCAGDSVTLTAGGVGTDNVIDWHIGDCNGTVVDTGPSVVVTPPTNPTLYYARARNSNSGCSAVSCAAAVSVTVTSPPTVADAGSDRTICPGGTTTALGANTPTSGTGSWSVFSGGAGNFSSNSDPAATFTHTSGAGPIVLRWTISNSPCPDSTDDLTVTIVGSCDDSDACTTDYCQDGVCHHDAITCDDSDACTTDSCDPEKGCVFSPVDCDDNDACTADSCDGGNCINAPISCDDSNPCTTDSCNPLTGCVHTGSCAVLTLNVVGSGMVCASGTLDVKLDVSGLSDAINGVQVRLQYSTALLTLSSVTPGDGAGSPWDLAMPVGLIDTAGAVTYALTLTGPGAGTTANATVATLHFAVQLPGVNTDPTYVVFRPDAGSAQTKLTRTSDSSTILPGKVDSGPILVGPRVTVSLHVQGLTNAVTRDVRFTLTDCDNLGSPLTLVRPVAFNASGNGSVVLTSATLSSAADYLAVVEGHTLQRRVPLSWTSCFATASLTGGSELIAGDLQTAGVSQDNIVDILDFAILAARFGTAVSDCGVGLPQDCSLGADITGDGVQDTGDFNAIQMNFFTESDAAHACPPIPLWHKGPIEAPVAGEPEEAVAVSPTVGRLSVRTSELPKALSATGRADLNGDGVVDVQDIRAFAQARGLRLQPQFEAKLRTLEATSVAPSR